MSAAKIIYKMRSKHRQNRVQRVAYLSVPSSRDKQRDDVHALFILQRKNVFKKRLVEERVVDYRGSTRRVVAKTPQVACTRV